MSDRLKQLDFLEDYLMSCINKTTVNDRTVLGLYNQLNKVTEEKNTIYSQQLEKIKQDGNSKN